MIHIPQPGCYITWMPLDQTRVEVEVEVQTDNGVEHPTILCFFVNDGEGSGRWCDVDCLNPVVVERWIEQITEDMRRAA